MSCATGLPKPRSTLFYAQQVGSFLLTDVHRAATRKQGEAIWEPIEDQRLQRVLSDLLRDAETIGKLASEDAAALRRASAVRKLARSSTVLWRSAKCRPMKVKSEAPSMTWRA